MATTAFKKAEVQLKDSMAQLEEANARGSEKLKAYVRHFEATFKSLREREEETEAAAKLALRRSVDALNRFLEGREKAVKEGERVCDS